MQLEETVVNKRGKVLIPVYAVGRLQELLLVVEEYWQRHGLKVSRDLETSAHCTVLYMAIS
jgi:Cft2 family RNA processing exonuclease